LETNNLAILGGTVDEVDIDIGNLKLRRGAVSGATAIFECRALGNSEGYTMATFQMVVGEVKVFSV
jgi:hypothetical protein